jgi:hypothetical protein
VLLCAFFYCEICHSDIDSLTFAWDHVDSGSFQTNSALDWPVNAACFGNCVSFMFHHASILLTQLNIYCAYGREAMVMGFCLVAGSQWP